MAFRTVKVVEMVNKNGRKKPVHSNREVPDDPYNGNRKGIRKGANKDFELLTSTANQLEET